jgi:hypothetical protein
MDAQGTMRLMFDTMDAYDRSDFDRLEEIYAEDAQWINADPGRTDRTGQRLRPGRQRVQLRGTPHRDHTGLPVDGGCRVGARASKPVTSPPVVASMEPRFARLTDQ